MNVLDLFATLRLDSSQYEDGLNDASNKAKSIGSAVSTGFKVTAGVTAAAFSTAGVAVANLTKQAVSSYAQFEQLEGGVQKLYGSAADELMGYAKNAFATSGMSMNQYMETATSFSAALVSSLEGDVSEAAKITDVAMRAISDNVNVFGSDFSSVQTAFQGFAKQNYTMLDNLKLGYGGTKEEMERLIDDANEYRASIGQTSDLTIDSFSDVVQAIQSVQEKQNIAGTTASEAMRTIEGSATATKAAWDNVITAVGRGEGLSEAFDALTTSIFGKADGEGLLNQVIPRIETALSGVGDFIAKGAPFIVAKIPELFTAILPAFLQATTDMVSNIAGVLPDAFSTLFDFVFTEGINLLNGLAEGVQAGLPVFLEQALPMLLSFTENLRSNFGTLVDAGLELIVSLANGLIAALPTLIEYVPQIVTNIAGLINDNAPKLIETAFNLIIALGQGLINSIPVIIANAGNIITAIVSVFQAFNWVDLGSKAVQMISDGIRALVSMPGEIFRNIGQNIINVFKNGFSWSGLGKAIIDGIVSGIKGAGRAIGDTLMGFAKDAWSSVKKFFGIASPSKLMRDTIGKFIPAGMAEGIEENSDSVAKAMSDLSDLTTSSFDLGTPNFGISGTGGPTTRNITINVYGAEGQDVEELADIVADRINRAVRNEDTVYA